MISNFSKYSEFVLPIKQDIKPSLRYVIPLQTKSFLIIHYYHELFDKVGYRKRRVDKTTKGRKLNPIRQ